MKVSYGFVETRGFVAAILAADAMVKAAQVELVPYRKIGSAYVTVIVKGELGACQAAVEAGVRAAEQAGELVSYHIIANPYPDTDHQLEPQPQPAAPAPPKGKQRGSRQKARGRHKTPEEQILEKLKKQPKGATLKELSQQLGKPADQVRLILKRLMDQGKVEKIQQKYFIL